VHSPSRVAIDEDGDGGKGGDATLIRRALYSILILFVDVVHMATHYWSQPQELVVFAAAGCSCSEQNKFPVRSRNNYSCIMLILIGCTLSLFHIIR
jgi:hypothetical protein